MSANTQGNQLTLEWKVSASLNFVQLFSAMTRVLSCLWNVLQRMVVVDVKAASDCQGINASSTTWQQFWGWLCFFSSGQCWSFMSAVVISQWKRFVQQLMKLTSPSLSKSNVTITNLTCDIMSVIFGPVIMDLGHLQEDLCTINFTMVWIKGFDERWSDILYLLIYLLFIFSEKIMSLK